MLYLTVKASPGIVYHKVLKRPETKCINTLKKDWLILVTSFPAQLPLAQPPFSIFFSYYTLEIDGYVLGLTQM